jgi:hypothetical protein
LLKIYFYQPVRFAYSSSVSSNFSTREVSLYWFFNRCGFRSITCSPRSEYDDVCQRYSILQKILTWMRI